MSCVQIVGKKPGHRRYVNLMVDSTIKHAMMKQVKVRVFRGGEDAAQVTSFVGAVSDLHNEGVHFKVKYMAIQEVKERRMTPAMLVDWLLDCDVHIILSHLHQGTSNSNEQQMGWNMVELYTELDRLSDHVGYPTGTKLQCPVFTQNKYNYLQPIPTFVNPTLRIAIWDSTKPYPQNDANHDDIVQ